jgi:hypothetical protein
MQWTWHSRTKFFFDQKLLSFVARSCQCFQSFEVHSSMSVESVIEKLQKITRKKEGSAKEWAQKQEEEAKSLRRIKAFEELKKTKRKDMLNIRPLVVRSLLHSSSLSSKCAKGKMYNEKIKLSQILYINSRSASVRPWHDSSAF